MEKELKIIDQDIEVLFRTLGSLKRGGRAYKHTKQSIALLKLQSNGLKKLIKS